MTAPTTLALVRHGETDWNAERRIQGRSDVPLNDTGRAQVRATAAELNADDWDFVVCSPLSRARESADILAAELGLEVVREIPELVERHYGLAEGMQDGDELRALRIPGGFVEAETEEAVAVRASLALREIVETSPGSRVIVVAHGTFIRLGLAALSGGPVANISNAGHCVIEHVLGDDDVAEWSLSIVNGAAWTVPAQHARRAALKG
ncbi:histidine phosphatase family protein [Subtercola sp. Z020]|uniref:histidine phosphatase family protein n=1 Tax=Subtercola sp. Z020 TaxID=2080582 RepID=UPI000CE8FC87|nr:histidine phosphatase family protein [Subtercola sp. Z020]PPF78623.1 histidine phosphatase family protein [Subtercola sp. Z020]